MIQIGDDIKITTQSIMERMCLRFYNWVNITLI